MYMYYDDHTLLPKADRPGRYRFCYYDEGSSFIALLCWSLVVPSWLATR